MSNEKQSQAPSREQLTIERLQAQAKRTERVRGLHSEIYAEAQKNRGKADPYYQALDIACNVIANMEDAARTQQATVEELARRVAESQNALETMSKELAAAKAANSQPANDTPAQDSAAA